MRSDPTLRAVTPVASSAMLLIVANTSIQAWHRGAVADAGFAVGVRVTRRTLAGVRALACVEAGSSVLAWFVVRAKVQILIAEQTTPAFVAKALPRFLAGSVHASRVGFAFVAKSSFPSGLTSVGKKQKKDMFNNRANLCQFSNDKFDWRGIYLLNLHY